MSGEPRRPGDKFSKTAIRVDSRRDGREPSEPTPSESFALARPERHADKRYPRTPSPQAVAEEERLTAVIVRANAQIQRYRAELAANRRTAGARQTIVRGAAAAAGLLILVTVAIVWGPAGVSGVSPWFGDSGHFGRVATGAAATPPREALATVTGQAATSPVVGVVAKPRVVGDTPDTIVAPTREAKIASAAGGSVVAATGVAKPTIADAFADALNEERYESSPSVAGTTGRMPAERSIGFSDSAPRSDRVTASRVVAAPSPTLSQPLPPAHDNGSETGGAAPAARVSVPFPISEPTFPVPDVRPETVAAGGGTEVALPNTPAWPAVSAQPKSSTTPARQRDATPQDPQHDERLPAGTAAIDETIPGVVRSEQPLTRDAVLVSGPPPRYPESVRKQEQGGAVDVEITIDAQGRVVDARALFGPRPLWSFAEAAVLRWRFDPARADGIPVASRRRVRMLFQ